MGISDSLFYILIALITVLVFYIKQHFSYWKRHDIPHDPPHFLYGNLKNIGKTRHLRDITKEYYEKFKKTGPFAGMFFFITPAVMILDLDLVRNILIKDFHNFTDRGLFHNERDDPLTGHLFSIDAPKWRYLRNKLTPTFTSGKMKAMFSTVITVADQLMTTFDQICEKNPVVEVKDILARFTVDVIGTCAFGLDCNSLTDPNAEFRIMGSRAFTDPRHSRLVAGFMLNFPRLSQVLRMRHIKDDIHEFYMRVVRETVEFREKNSIKRNDFMNLLIELKNTEGGLTIEEIAAQSFVFFLAGFETSSTTMGFALYELAKHQDIQDKLRAEINTHFEKHGGEMTYDCMTEMQYMEMVMKETLRKYSVVTNLQRRAKNAYPTSDPKYVIPKGATILIPADAIHRDPDIYPDPETFNPERFSPEEMMKRHPLTWLPFGDGPRNCIGLRFGKMQTYIGLSMLLRRYKFLCCEQTPKKLEVDVKNTLYAAKGGMNLLVERIS